MRQDLPPSSQTLSGKSYVFSSWSDGKGQQHSIVTGATPTTYTATFKSCTKIGTSAGEILGGTSSADVICAMGGNDIILGGGGADKVKGNTGADSLYGEDGNDALNSQDGVSGNDSLSGGAGTDTKVTDPTENAIVGFP